MERALRAAGVDVTTATTYSQRCTAALTGGAGRVYARRLGSFYKFAPGLIPWLWRNVPRFDAVHIHALFSFASVAAAYVASLRGTPYVLQPLGSLSPFGLGQRRPRLKRLSLTFVEGPILRAAAAVHFASAAEKEEAGRLNIPVRGVVIPLGVELVSDGAPAFDDPSARGRRRVLFLSRLDPVKNLEALIDAFASSLDLRETATLIVAGRGDEEYVAALKARARDAGIADRVLWLGHVEGPQKAALLQAADLFILPSFSESFGVAAVEAMLAGLPCVLSRSVAIASAAAAAGACAIVEPQAGAIRHAIEALLSEPDKLTSMGAAARAFAVREYSPQTMAKRLIDLYRSVSKGRQSLR